MEVKQVLSSRGSKLLVSGAFKYRRDKMLKSGEQYWRCVEKKCSAKIFTLGHENLVCRSDVEHNHEADLKTVNRQIISNSAKRKAIEDISERPSKIIHQTLKEHVDELKTLSVKDIKYIRHNIYRNRRNLQPVLPTSRSDVLNILSNMNIQTIKSEPFLLINDRDSAIVVFSCDGNVQLLCKSNRVYMDDTFSYCTKHILQLFTLHILENGHYIPLAFCLLPNKEEKTYRNLFVLLIKKCADLGYILKPKIVAADFEKAIHNAVFSVWPEINLIGCRFHLGQAWFRKIQNLGLVQSYKDDHSGTGRWMRYLFGLPFLKPSEVGDCFALDFAAIQPEEPKITQLADYIVENYIDEDAKFPPSIWAEASASMERTTNACESFHSRFNANFYSTHPSLYIFLDILINVQTDTYIKIQSINEPQPLQNKNVRRRRDLLNCKIDELNSERITRFHFVKCASYYYKV